MSLSDQEYQLIQKYLADSLNTTDKEIFDKKIKEAPFQKELVFQAKLIDALDDLDHKQLKDNIESSPKKVLKNSKSSLKYLLGFLALVAILALIFFGLKSYADKPIASPDLIAQYNTPYPPYEFQRGESDQLAKEFKSAMLAYANEEYQVAIIELAKSNTQDELLQLYLANCHLQLNQNEQAAKLLEYLVKNKNPSIQQNAEWYLSIAKLGTKDEEQGKNLLLKISKTEKHLFHEKAVSLLQRIQK